MINVSSRQRFAEKSLVHRKQVAQLDRRNFVLTALGAAVAIRSGAAQTASPVSGQGDSAELYRIELAAGLLPQGELVVGAVLQELTSNSSVTYPVGSAPESLAIDYVVSGGYEATSTSDLSVVGEDGTVTDADPGDSIEVRTDEALIVVDNEEELTTRAGDEPTVSLTLGFFTFAEGSGDVEIEGDLVSTFLGAPPPLELPPEGITVLLRAGAEDAANWPDALVVLPVTTANPVTEWTFVILPPGAGSSADGVATPVD